MGRMERGQLMTESLSESKRAIDQLSLSEALERLHQADQEAVQAVHAAQGEIAGAVELLSNRVQAGGRVFYVGAGTSGRLATLDAAELPPTFGVPETLFQALIAGGTKALNAAVEGAEDDHGAGAEALAERELGPKDAVLGIAAGGTTPFVHGALKYAQQVGAGTIFVACIPREQFEDPYDLSIRLLCGPEEVQGSTRMKAGTATKLCLNALSTLVMVGLGKVHRGRMVDVSTRGNEKLIDRGERLVMDLAGVDRPRAKSLLEASDGQVKPAVLMARLNLDLAAAQANLKDHAGHLGACLGGEQ